MSRPIPPADPIPRSSRPNLRWPDNSEPGPHSHQLRVFLSGLTGRRSAKPSCCGDHVRPGRTRRSGHVSAASVSVPSPTRRGHRPTGRHCAQTPRRSAGGNYASPSTPSSAGRTAPGHFVAALGNIQRAEHHLPVRTDDPVTAAHLPGRARRLADAGHVGAGARSQAVFGAPGFRVISAAGHSAAGSPRQRAGHARRCPAWRTHARDGPARSGEICTGARRSGDWTVPRRPARRR